MPAFLPASRACWLFCCVSLAASVAFAPQVLGQQYVEVAAPAPAAASSSSKKITVQLWVIEVETEKLRNLGFAWNQITSSGKWVTTPVSTAGEIANALGTSSATEFRGFLKALEQNSLARTLAEPTLVTLSGREASLQVGEQTKLEVTPTALDDRHVQLTYQIEVGSEAQATEHPHLINGSTVQVEAGKPCLISHTRSSAQSANGKRRQTEILLLLQADRLP